MNHGKSQLRSSPAQQAIAFACLFILALVIIVLFWPGYPIPDVTNMMNDARRGIVTDQYSPLIASVLKYGGALASKIWILFFLQTVLLIVGSFLVFRDGFKPVAAAVITALIILSPAIFARAVLVERDIWMLSSLLIAIGLCSHAMRYAGRRRLMALAAAAFAIAVCVMTRQNAIFFVLPTAFYWSYVLMNTNAGQGLRSKMIRYSPSIILIMSIAVVAIASDGMFVNKRVYPRFPLIAYDLAGMSVNESTVLIPQDVLSDPDATVSDVDSRFLFKHAGTIVFPQGSQPAVIPWEPSNPSIKDTYVKLDEAWRKAVLRNPAGYLKVRFRMWRAVVALDTIPYETVWMPTQLDQLHAVKHAGAWKFLDNYVSFFTDTKGRTGGAVFSAWIYLALGIAAAVIALILKRRNLRIVPLLAASAVLGQIGLFFFTPAGSYRYEITAVYLSLIAVTFVIGEGIRVLWSNSLKSTDTSSESADPKLL